MTSHEEPAPAVVSLVPSATETLVEWGITPLAVTRFCDRPDLPSVGGTKDPDLPAVLALAPALVVMCVEENRREDAEALRSAGLRVHAIDIDTVADVSAEMARLAAAVGVHPTPITPAPDGPRPGPGRSSPSGGDRG